MVLTARRIIVCTTAVAAAANAGCKQVDTVGGQYALTVPLRAAGDATNTTAAYWVSWLFDPVMLATLKTKAVAAGFTVAETTELLVGFTSTPATVPRLALFDDAVWSSPRAVLVAMGLDTMLPAVY